MPRVIRTLLVAALAMLFCMLPTATGIAQAASYINEATQGLQTSNVYVSRQTSGLDAAVRQQLEQQGAGKDIAIIVLPAQAASETGGDTTAFVNEIDRRTNYDTVVVVFGKDLVAGSRAMQAGEAAQLADKAEAENGDVGRALLQFVQEVDTRPVQTPSASPSDDGFGIGAILVVCAVVIVGLGLAAGIVIRNARRRNQPQVNVGHRRELETIKLSVDGELREQLEEMLRLASQIDENDDSELRRIALRAVSETDELFVEIRAQLKDRVMEKSAEFKVHLERVNRVLRMYLRAQDNPRRFATPAKAEEVKADTRRSIVSYGEKVHQNIVRVNEGEMLEFEVDVTMLNQGTTNPLQDQ